MALYYDTEGFPLAIIVTGSAKPDSYRKAGVSHTGRFFQFRLHPLDLKEIKSFLITIYTRPVSLVKSRARSKLKAVN